MSTFLDRLGRLAARRPWRVIAVWLLVAIGIGILALASGGKTVDDFTIPGAESQRALDLLEQRFASQSGGSAQVVVHARSGTLADPTAEAVIEQAVARIKKLPSVTQVTGPVPSKDKTIALVNVQYDQEVATLGKPAFAQLLSASAVVDAVRCSMARAEPAPAGSDTQLGGARCVSEHPRAG